MQSKVTLAHLNALINIQFEDWPKHNVRLKAVSANADGMVNSGILKDGRYFYRKWEQGFKTSQFTFGD